MAKKKKSRKKASKRKSEAKFLDLGEILTEIEDAQKELRRIRAQLVKVRTLCRRLRVEKA